MNELLLHTEDVQALLLPMLSHKGNSVAKRMPRIAFFTTERTNDLIALCATSAYLFCYSFMYL
jgi:hypothetical protein